MIYLYYGAINLSSFILYYIDKQKAIHHQYRISEKTLFLFSILGGSPVSLFAMFLFHHKTKKSYFYFIHFLSIVFHFLFLKYLFCFILL